MSTRADVVPAPWIDKLRMLQDALPAKAYSSIVESLEDMVRQNNTLSYTKNRRKSFAQKRSASMVSQEQLNLSATGAVAGQTPPSSMRRQSMPALVSAEDYSPPQVDKSIGTWISTAKSEDFAPGGAHWPFRAIEETPLATASIGQVHKATLIDGRQIVFESVFSVLIL